MSLPPVIAKGRWPLAGLVGIAVFLALVARFWHPIYGFTVFYQLAAPNDELKITAFRELPVYVHRDTGGYDGLYYAQIAHDPTLRDPELPRAMDDYPYRARRILAPALAWLFGAGQPAWIIHTYAALNIVAWVALAVVLWCVLAVNSFRGWCAWVGVLFSAGALGSVRLALTDVLAVLLIAAAVYAAERWRGRLAVALLAASALARETAVFAIVGLCKAPWFSAKNLARLVLAAAPLAAWLVYVRWQVGAGNPGWGNFTVPGAGLVEKWREALGALSTVGDKPLAWTTLLATLAITAQGAFFLTRRLPGDRWWRIGITYTGLMLLLGTAVWEGFPGAATRVLLPLHLAFAVVVQRTRASVAWLVVGNLSVLAGLLTLRDIPREANELVAQDLGSTVAVVRFADDWYGRENDRRHVWLWAQQRGTLTLETIPPAAQAEAHAQAGADVSLHSWREEPIGRHHDRKTFDCGVPELNIYLERYARQNH
ncbi:MAG: hypothetical protein V4773_26690, partial [Verrucomicrobiota bacterium]